jgi:hypothetical protein
LFFADASFQGSKNGYFLWLGKAQTALGIFRVREKK